MGSLSWCGQASRRDHHEGSSFLRHQMFSPVLRNFCKQLPGRRQWFTNTLLGKLHLLLFHFSHSVLSLFSLFIWLMENQTMVTWVTCLWSCGASGNWHGPCEVTCLDQLRCVAAQNGWDGLPQMSKCEPSVVMHIQGSGWLLGYIFQYLAIFAS